MRRLALTLALCCVTSAYALPPLRWGGDAEGGAPFVEADPSDPSKLRGFDVEVAGEIARGLGREPQFVQVAFTAIDQSVARGDFDIGMSGVEDTPARRAALSATIPYFEFREVITVRPADRSRFRTLADFRGRRIGTLGGTIAYEILLANAPKYGFEPISYDDDVHPYEDLKNGRLDGVLLDHIIAARAMHRTGGLFTHWEGVATGHYIGVLAKDNAALRDRINRILLARMADGTLERIYRKWDIWDDAQAAFVAATVKGQGPRAEGREKGQGPRAEGQGADTRSVEPSSSPSALGPRPSALPDSALGSGPSALPDSALVLRYIPALLKASVITILMSCLAMAMAVAIGVIVATGRIYGGTLLRALFTAYVEITRGTPVLLQLFVIYYGLSAVVRLPAFVAALVGLGLNYAAYESEIYRGAMEAVPRGQLEAARTLGFSESQVFRLVRGPQAFRLALAPMTNDFVALLKDSSLVSVITVVELTKQTQIFAANIGSWVVPGILCASLYLAMSLPLSRAARALERRWRMPSQ